MRLVDADKLNMYLADVQLANRGWRDDFCDTLDDIIEAVDEQPTIDPESLRPKGRWEINDLGYLVCTNCSWVRYGIPLVEHFKHCPNCGADMRGESK